MIYYHMLSPVERIILKLDNEESCRIKKVHFSKLYGSIPPFLQLTEQISFRFVFLVLLPTTATEGNRCFDVHGRIW